jgi:hypothetical protein
LSTCSSFMRCSLTRFYNWNLVKFNHCNNAEWIEQTLKPLFVEFCSLYFSASPVNSHILWNVSVSTRSVIWNVCSLAIYKNSFRAYAKMAASSNQYVGGGTKTVGMFSKLVSQGSSFVMEGVKNLVVKRHVSSVFCFWMNGNHCVCVCVCVRARACKNLSL